MRSCTIPKHIAYVSTTQGTFCTDWNTNQSKTKPTDTKGMRQARRRIIPFQIVPISYIFPCRWAFIAPLAAKARQDVPDTAMGTAVRTGIPFSLAQTFGIAAGQAACAPKPVATRSTIRKTPKQRILPFFRHCYPWISYLLFSFQSHACTTRVCTSWQHYCSDQDKRVFIM